MPVGRLARKGGGAIGDLQFCQRIARDQVSKIPSTSEGEALAPPGNNP